MEFKFNNTFNTFSYDDPDESGKAVVDKDVRLRSFNDLEKYCKDNDILYDKSLFDLNSTVDHKANRPEASNIEVLIPRHFKDAKNSPQSDKWQDAMKEKIKVMKERDVWELVPAPQDSKVLGCRWVYTLKTDSKGEICRYKARLVVQGHNQQKGESYDETFSPENVLLIVYIDDIVIFEKSQDDIDNVVSLLQSKFDLKVLGKIKKLVGIEFSDINGQYFIHQKQYIDKICKVFSKYNFPHASIPIAKGSDLSKLDCPSNTIEVEEPS
ncbi:retrovirus-related Pol polyprotein from transposon TNT 1-94 [Trichonephila clavipes]|nr:retrovirus-related Pol polyprotein from transposon TNT 1-94 [Trichonephila clavipes]